MNQLRSLTYIANSRLPSEKANGSQVMHMCAAFAAKGLAVELLYPFRIQPGSLRGRDPFSFYSLAPTFRIRRLPSLDFVWLDPVTRGPFRRVLKWSLVQAGTFSASARAAVRSSFGDPNHIFYGRDEYTFMLLARARHRIRGRLYFEAHRFPGPRAQKPLLKMVERLDGLIVVTKALQAHFAAQGVPPSKIFVAHDAVALEQFSITQSREAARDRLGLPKDRPIIGYVGRFQTMGMEKGIETLIDSLPSLRTFLKQDPLLVCVGGPLNSVSGYRRRLRERSVPDDWVRFVDRQPPEDVPTWIRACDVATIPFPWTEHLAYFASPLKLFEYMAVGTPIVASDLPALREILTPEHNALLAKPGDPGDLARQLARLLHDAPLAHRLATQAKNDVRQYTWDARAAAILGFIGDSRKTPPAA